VSSERLKELSIPPRILKAIRDLVDSLKKLSGDVRVYLFGSYARGTWIEDSDVDLVIVSSYFEGMESSERYKLVRRLASDEVSFELLIYTPREFEEALKRSIVLKDASRYWVEIT